MCIILFKNHCQLNLKITKMALVETGIRAKRAALRLIINVYIIYIFLLESLVLKLPLGVTFNNQYGNPP